MNWLLPPTAVQDVGLLAWRHHSYFCTGGLPVSLSGRRHTFLFDIYNLFGSFLVFTFIDNGNFFSTIFGTKLRCFDVSYHFTTQSQKNNSKVKNASNAFSIY